MGAKVEVVLALTRKRSMLNTIQPNSDIAKGIPNPTPKPTSCELLLGQLSLGQFEVELIELGLGEFDTVNPTMGTQFVAVSAVKLHRPLGSGSKCNTIGDLSPTLNVALAFPQLGAPATP